MFLRDDKADRRAVVPIKPCGGFAFRAARTVKPGGSWVIEGALELAEGNHTVTARYCPTAASLKEVDPRVRAERALPWWLGCVDSPPAQTSLRK